MMGNSSPRQVKICLMVWEQALLKIYGLLPEAPSRKQLWSRTSNSNSLKMLVFIGSFILTVIAASVQATNWILLGDIIKPNLIFVILMILGVMNPGWIRRAVLVLAAALILKFAPGFSFLDLTFIGAVAASMVLMDFLPWRQPINLLLAVIVGTIII